MTDELTEAIEEVIDGSEAAVEDYREGQDEALNYLVGRVLSEVGGDADPMKVAEELRSEIPSG